MSDTEFTLEQRDAISRAFSAGNYANAYVYSMFRDADILQQRNSVYTMHWMAFAYSAGGMAEVRARARGER